MIPWRLKTFQVAVLAGVCAVALLGCGRKKAADRVLEAVNPKVVEVSNGQAAILRLSGGYAAIVPTYVQHNEIKYRVFSSSNGVFQASTEPVQEGVVTTTTPVEVGGVRVFVGYGGENTTSVMLDFGDNQTGIALFPTNDLRLLNASRIEFKQGKSLNPEDLMKAIGEK